MAGGNARTPEAAAGVAKREMVVTRVFEAPRSLVFAAWTDPERLARWWGPRGFTNPRCEWDARPGGAIRIDMQGPDGTLYPMDGLVREVVEPERLVFSSAALDSERHRLFEVRHVVTLAEGAGRTTVTLRARVVASTPEAPPDLEGMEEGWTQSLERLGALLARPRPGAR